MKISQEQIAEWVENPVTDALLALSKTELESIENTDVTECYFPGEPFKTQDNLSDLNTRGVTWRLFCDLLAGDWSHLEEDSE